MNRAYWGKVWVVQYGQTANRKHKIGALTESYLYSSNKWKLSRIDQVVAQFSTTKFSAGCATSWGDAGADWAGNSRTASTEHTNSGEVSWNSVWSNHRIKIGTNVFSFDQELKPCP